ncbi:MAG: zinc-dependent metalloprotease [Bryobacteraceae bacterium]
MAKLPGFLPMYWDAKTGKLWLEVDRAGNEFLYISSLPAGIGSNDIGLDRGQLSGTRIVKFERSGPKLLLVQQNESFRAISNDPAERKAVEDSFAKSVLWGFTIDTEENGRMLVDASAFYLRDVHNAAATLQRSRQGAFKLDPARSAFYEPRTRNFPKNTEVEVTLTFAGEQPGPWLRGVSPDPGSVTVREHHSFVELPSPGFKPRAYDPRSSFHGIEYMDFATPISEPISKRFAARHRLEKKDPSAALSEPVKPITYYLDRGAPEPIRSALLEGARWWNQAFEAAGYKNAFRVELLPEDADPMDVRYNMIQWVHRSTRGWSYGSSVTDPRTGEIIKGHVTLGSLRVRQDYLIAEGLLAPYETGKPAPPAMAEMALARLRQLSAHEVGHTLGLQHNYAASTRDRSSVMDYPHPWIDLGTAGTPSLVNAYAVGIGTWDKISITWGYSDFAPGADEKKTLEGILRKANTDGFLFISDSDSRPEGSAHPQGHLWDSGANAVDELNRLLKVRAQALARFGERNIREGDPMSKLEDVLVPLYMLHRYQTEAASKVLGGLDYTYGTRGDGYKLPSIVPGAEQKRALDALLKTIDPATLEIPAAALAIIPPQAEGYRRTREDFRARTGLTFDPLGAAESAADLTARLILNPERAARLVQYHARDASVPGLGEVIDRLVGATWKAPVPNGLQAEIRRTVDNVVLYHLMVLANNEAAPGQVRAMASAKLDALQKFAGSAVAKDDAQRAHLAWAVSQIKRYRENPKEIPVTKPVEAPPGQPIGCEDQP